MLSLQHAMLTMLFCEKIDSNETKEMVAYAVLPDAIRCYTGPREYSHFEANEDHSDVSFMKYPKDIKSITKESIQESLAESGHLCPRRPCIIGEDTDMEVFKQHNSHLPFRLWCGIAMHLCQDITFDNFIRDTFDTTQRYDDKFYRNGKELDGKQFRNNFTEWEQFGVYALAQAFYEQYGITTNNDWIQNSLKPIFDEYYPQDMADKTVAYMNIRDDINTWITNHDFSHFGEMDIVAEGADKENLAKLWDIYNIAAKGMKDIVEEVRNIRGDIV